jgi:hypothetical protein
MICRQDAYGGNIQSGCGAEFDWPKAQLYTPATTFQPEQLIIHNPDNPIVPHIGVQLVTCFIKKNDQLLFILKM